MMDLFPLINSLRISSLATLLTLLIGVLAAHKVSLLPRKWKGLIDAVLTIPMVLPPTVIGYLILLVIAPKRPLGELIDALIGTSLTMKWYASVIAVTLVTFPLMYRTIRSSFEAIDPNLRHAASILGLHEPEILFRILLPNAKSGILAGLVLSFARGLGEYGATSMVSGYIAGRTATVSTTVAHLWQTGQDNEAMFWVLINLILSLVIMIVVNLFENKKAGAGR
jgi:molybdate transport system permease protein